MATQWTRKLAWEAWLATALLVCDTRNQTTLASHSLQLMRHMIWTMCMTTKRVKPLACFRSTGTVICSQLRSKEIAIATLKTLIGKLPRGQSKQEALTRLFKALSAQVSSQPSRPPAWKSACEGSCSYLPLRRRLWLEASKVLKTRPCRAHCFIEATTTL